MPVSQPTFAKSLAGRLFKLVFGGYLVLAVLVTAVQLVLEYSSVRKTIGEDLVSLGQSFNGGVAGAMWELDRPLLRTMAQGIAQSSIVTGVRIATPADETIAEVGSIPDRRLTDGATLFSPYQFNSTRLQRNTPQGLRELGDLTIYADRSVAIERVKYSFFVILINSLIKTAGLWLIFVLVITKGLSQPLARLTGVVSQLEFAAESKDKIALNYPHEDELGRLVVAMQKMQERLFAARCDLDSVNARLEETVVERTRHLSEAIEFNRAVLQNSPLPMAVYAENGDCVVVNARYAEMFGGTPEALLAKRREEMAWMTAAGFDQDCLDALRDGLPRQRELRLVDAGGAERWIEGRVLPVQLNGQGHVLVQLIDLTERKRLEEELRHLANHDPLTRLPNRRLLLDRLQRAITACRRHRSHAALLFIDLDKFKALNDRWGHEAGDRWLVEVANRLLAAVRDVDTVARLGGDEFVVLLEGLGEERKAAEKHVSVIVGKIQQAIAAGFVFDGVVHEESASIGYVLFLGDDDPDRLLRRADEAMYVAKKQSMEC